MAVATISYHGINSVVELPYMSLLEASILLAFLGLLWLFQLFFDLDDRPFRF